MTTPAAATQIIVRPRTGSGWLRRRIASAAIAPDADEKQNGVEERGEHGSAAQAVGETFGRAAAGEIARGPGHEQSHHIPEIVAGIGEERERMAEQTEDALPRR